MESLTVGFIKVNAGLLIMLLAYLLFLQKEKFFSANRAFLLSALLLPLVFLIVPGARWSPAILWPAVTAGFGGGGTDSAGPVSTGISSGPDLAEAEGFSFLTLTGILYGCVSLFLLLRICIRLFRITRLIRGCQRERRAGHVFCFHQENLPAFSFFGWIVMNPALYTPETYCEIIRHETAHSMHWHSIDIILADLMQALFWINPATLMIKRCLTLNLEYAADREVIAGGLDKKHYQYSLLEHCLGTGPGSLVNAFQSSKIKRRIYMMNSSRSTQRNRYRFLLVLPFILLTYLAVSPARADNGLHYEQASIPFQSGTEGYYQSDQDSTMYVLIGKKAGKLTLKQMWDGMEFSFEEKTALTYYNEEHSFPLVFTKSAGGEITSLLAFGRDTWIKTKNYREQKAITLPADQLQRYAGKYSMTDNGREVVLDFAVKGPGIEVTETWRGNSFMILPESKKVFFGQNMRYPVEFSFDDKGNVTQALIYHHDVWKKK